MDHDQKSSEHGVGEPGRAEGKMRMSYWRFAAMIATSTAVMYGLMYLNTYALEHVYWSEARAWIALVMGATMVVIMLGFMLNMYKKDGMESGDIQWGDLGVRLGVVGGP